MTESLFLTQLIEKIEKMDTYEEYEIRVFTKVEKKTKLVEYYE